MPFCSVSKACRLIDILCICLLITPLAVLYWAGTWRIFDLYIFPQRTRLSATVSLAAGTTGGIVGYFLLPLLRTRIHPSCNFNHAIVSRMFCYAYGLCFLNTWRGLWMWTDELLGTGLVSSWVRLIIAESLLILCGCSTNTVSIPFTITLDTRPSFYLTFPCFRTQVHVTQQSRKRETLNQCWVDVGQRRRRWANINPALVQSLVFAGLITPS